MNLKKLEKHFVIILAVSLVTFFFSTCEIGLGAAVDTEAPVFSISIPNTEKVDIIRGDFPVSGTWSDDGTIDSLEVNIFSGENSVHSGKATVTKSETEAGKGTWAYIVSPSELGIKDGSYGISVKIKDHAGHVSTASTQIIVDNTSPIIVLQRPSTTAESSSSDIFGQTLSLVGQLADDTGVSRLEMNVFADKECNNSLLSSPILLESVTTLDNTIAEFSATDKNVYYSLYGSNSLEDGEKQRYFTITSYDNAIHYPVDGTAQTAEDKLGNKSEIYYLYDDIADAINAYTITGLYKIKSGNFTESDSSRAVSKDTVISKFDQAKISVGSFSLNPANNPTFVVSGKAQLPDAAELKAFFADKNKSYITNKSTVQLEVSPGLDGIAIASPTELKPYVLQYKDDGTIDTTPVYLTVNSIKPSGSSYKIETLISTVAVPQLNIGKNYFFGVEGQDTDGNKIKAAGSGFGFHLSSAGEAPKLTVTAPAETTFYKKLGDSVSVAGNVVYEEKGTVCVKLNDEVLTTLNSTGTKYPFTYEIPSSKFSQEKSAEYVIDVYAEEEEIRSPIHSYKVIYDVKAPSITISEPEPVASKYNLTGDKAGTPADSEKYLNGTVSLSVTVEDDLAREESEGKQPVVTFKGKDSAGKDKTVQKNMTTFPSQTFTVNTTDFADGDFSVTVEAYDVAGNKGTTTSPVYKVSQETDRPVILPFNSQDTSFELDAAGANADSNSKYAFTSGSELYFKILDDDDTSGDGKGLSFIKIERTYYVAIRNSDGTTTYAPQTKTDANGASVLDTQITEGTKFYTGSDGKATDWAYQYALPETTGTYKIKVTVKDAAGLATGSSSKEFFVKVKAMAPKIINAELTTGYNRYVTSKTEGLKDVQVDFVINSDNAPFRVTKEIKTQADTVIVPFADYDSLSDESLELSQTGYPYFDTIIPSDYADGVYKVQYKVFDRDGTTGTSTIMKFTVDGTAPVVTDISVPTIEQTEVDSSNKVSYNFEITAADSGTGASGINKYYLGLTSCDDENGTNPQPAEPVYKDVNAAEYKSAFKDDSNFASVFAASGYKTVYAYTVDKVGNKGAVLSRNFVYDIKVPQITVAAPVTVPASDTETGVVLEKAVNTEGVVVQNRYNTGTIFSLSGTVSDDWGLAGTEGLVFIQTRSNGAVTDEPILINITPDENGNWNVATLPLKADGTAFASDSEVPTGVYSFTVKATDKAGKTSSSTPVVVEIDKTPPVLTVTEVSGILKGDVALFSGTASDGGLGIKDVRYQILESGATAPDVNSESWNTAETATLASARWSVSKNLIARGTTAANSLEEGVYKLYVKALDRAGNSVQSPTVSEFSVDKAAPEITTISLKTWKKPAAEETATLLSSKAISSGSVNYFKAKNTDNIIKLAGFITETNGLAETDGCTVKVNDIAVAAADFTLDNQSDGKYAFTITLTDAQLTENANITVGFALKDVAGQQSAVQYTLYNDTTPPSVEINTPATDISGTNSLAGSSFNFNATVKDVSGGSGLADSKFKYLFTKTSLADDAAITASAKAGTGWSQSDVISASGDWTLKQNLGTGKSGTDSSMLYEGQWYLYIYAEDAMGNATVGKRSFWIDQTEPKIENISDITATNGFSEGGIVIRNSGFTLSGKVSDPNGIKSLVIKDTYTPVGGGSSTSTIYPDSGSLSVGTDGGWSQIFKTVTETGNLADGKHVFSIIATDGADKTSEETRSVLIDTTAPQTTDCSVVLDAAADSDSESRVWYKSEYLGLNVTASDTGYGVAKVEVRISETASWGELTKQTDGSGNVSWKGSVQFIQQGANTVRLRITDKAGNQNTDISRTVYWDSKAPDEVTITSIKIGTSDENKYKTGLTNLLVNGRDDIVIEFTAKDANPTGEDGVVKSSGMASGSVVKPVATSAANATHDDGDNWSVKIEKSNIKSGTIEIKAVDKAGNEYTWNSGITITLDNTPPVIKKITLPDDADSTNMSGRTGAHEAGVDVNGIVKLSGIVTDNRSKFNSVDVSYYVDYESETVKCYKVWTPIYHNENTIETNWENVSIDTKALTGVPDGTPIYVAVVAVDEAGNCNLDTKDDSGKVTVNHKTVGEGTSYNVPKIAPSAIASSAEAVNKVVMYLNQDSDRPVITLNEISFTGMTSNSHVPSKDNSLTGKVDDDDGVETFEYKLDNAADWTTRTLNNSTFTISGISDGEHTLLFKVKDKKNTSFETTATTSLTGPKLTDGTNKLAYTEAASTAIYLKVDVTPPQIKKIEYKQKASANYAVYSPTSVSFGGTGDNNQFYLQIEAYDINGIESITVTLDKDSEDKDASGNALPDSTYTRTLNVTKSIGVTEDPFSVVGMVSGTRSFTITVNDGIQTTEETYTINIDNEAPEVKVTSHTEDTLILKNFILKGKFVGGDSGTQLKYIVSKSEEVPSESDWNGENAVTVANTQAGTWQVSFDQKQASASVIDGVSHDSDPKHLVVRLGSGLEINSSTGAVVSASDHTTKYTTKEDYYFHFKVTDAYGNSGTSKFKLRIDPQGDTPIVKLVSPSGTTENPNSTLMSGRIRVSGTASAENGLEGVYILVDPTYNGSVFSSTWYEDDLPNTAFTGGLEDNKEALGYDIKDIGSTGKKGIKISANQTWNITLNKNSEFDVSNGSNTIAIKLIACDIYGTVSEESDVFVIQVDAGAPRIGSSEKLVLRQYNDDDSVKNSMPYKDNIWLKGIWYLEGSIEDENGIKEVSVDGTSLVANSAIVDSEKISEKEGGWNSGTTTGYVLKYPVGVTDANYGSRSYTILAKDGDDKTYSQTITIRYDNKPPVLEDNTGISASVRNSEGFYTLKGISSEGTNESGFKMAVFYFMRPLAGYQNVYDTYIKKGVTGNAIAYGGTSPSITLGADKLYWKTGTVAANGIDGSNVTITAEDVNIHEGGLAKLGGTIYKITAVNGTKITLDGELDESLSDTSIYFAIGQVIDHEGSESEGTRASLITTNSYYGYYPKQSDGDEDYMIESVTTTNGNTTWTGSINSNNIPDGQIEIHYVVFDNAGNYSTGVVSGANVKNNAPRLAGLTIKSGGYETTYYNGGLPRVINGKSVDKATELTENLIVSSDGTNSGKAYITVKDAFDFYPELVGGNGDLFYSYYIAGGIDEKDNSQENIASKDEPYTGAAKFGTGNADGIDDYADIYNVENPGYYRKDDENSTYYEGKQVGKISVTESQLQTLGKNSSADNPTWFHYTIWDSTEGTNVNNGAVSTWTSLNASFHCALNVQYFDTDKPKVEINDLYWNSTSDNSLYHNSRDKGHIELKDDLTQALKNAYGDEKGKERDKVSGKITMRGTAEDNIRVSELWVKVDGFLTTDTKIASYDGTAWTSVLEDDDDANMTDYGWTCKVENEYDTDQGHKANWEFNWDTEKISETAPAAKDVKFTIYAKDATRGSSDTARPSDSKTYTVDVVPYITRVKTSLSSIQSDADTAMYGKNASVYDRTALGHYPVYVVGKDSTISSGEAIELKGFNLGTNSSFNSTTLSTAVDTTTNSTSAKYSVTVGGLSSINNLNDDTKTYNQWPNSDNNNNLTDDVVFDVWQFNSEAAITGTDKAGGKISQPVMKINPMNGKIGFAFVNGQFYASMANGTGNSYETWMRSRDFCTSISLTYDDLGHSFGTMAGGDVDGSILDKFNFVTSLWGKPGTDANTRSRDGTNAFRLESIGSGTSGDLTFEKQRIMSPSITTATHGKNTNIYLAYYDSQNDQIRFRSGSTAVIPVYGYDNGKNNYTFGHINLKANQTIFTEGMQITFCDSQGNELSAEDYVNIGYGNTASYYIYGVGHNPNSTDFWFTLSYTADRNAALDKTYSTYQKAFWNGDNTTYTESGNYKIFKNPLYIKFETSNEETLVKVDQKTPMGTLADIETDQTGDSGKLATTCQLIADSTYTNGKSGSFVSIATVPGNALNNDVVVAVWYSSDRHLWYSYNTSPLADRRNTKRDDSATDDGWSTPIQVFTGYMANSGQYCKIAVDADGGIHIAAYDPLNLDVDYAYASSYSADSFTPMVVDSNGVNGKYLTLDVAKNASTDTMGIPYIGYYSDSCLKPKMAYLLNASDLGAGSENDAYTGKWEISVVPTPSKIEHQSDQHNDINIGVWKNKDGILSDSTPGTSSTTVSTDNKGIDTGSNGTCYGNGTANPVLGYVITDDTIETAQKR